MKQNTLLSYFQRTPKAASPASDQRASSPPASNGSSTPVSRHSIESKRRRKPTDSSDSINKRRRVDKTLSYSVSDDDNTAETNGLSTPSTSRQVIASTPPAPRKLYSTPSTSTPSGSKLSADNDGKWLHTTLDFLEPGKIRDAAKNLSNHPDYDPKTLHVPLSFLEKCTPAIRQWWEMKSKFFDTMLFFKVGKFYELYHMDAVTAVQELGIGFMRGESAHCGFPETAYAKFSSVLVEKGHKVARIEQTETPDMMNERLKNSSRSTKFDKVVRREICQITTKGVRCATFQDETNASLFKSESLFLYAIVEKPRSGGPSDIGVCFVDTTIGKFHIGQFQDDKLFSRLRTLFSHYTPVQVLIEKGNKLSPGIQSLLNVMSGVKKESLVPGKEFWNEKTTLQTLSEGKYFWNATDDQNDFPDGLKPFVSKFDHLYLTPEQGYELAIRSLGAVMWYLKVCLLEFDLLSLKDFEMYNPLDSLEPQEREITKFQKHMVLDSETLRNLDITEGQGHLLSKIDYCVTAFGKRLLRHWVTMPLADPDEISQRLDAVEGLMELPEVTSTVTPILKSLPDLERLLSKVHTLGSEHRGKHHPDSRAFFFEEVKYSRRKVHDLLSVLKGFRSCVKIIHQFQSPDVTISSKLLSSIITEFPSLDDLLDYFDNAFDHAQAAEAGKIIPSPGVDAEYDDYCDKIDEIQADADKYIKGIGKQFKCKAVWFGSDKKAFQIEVPDSVKIPTSFELTSSKKGFKRYSTEESKEFLADKLKAVASRESVLKDLMRRVFEKIDSHRSTWSQAVKCIAMLDVLMSLTRFSLSREDMCRPKVVYSSRPFLDIEDGRHPCIPQDQGFIPNNSKLGDADNVDGGDNGLFALLTGPNMGGKSTLEKTMGLLTVLAQIGTYVPASKCEISVVDRIFTRVGANDNISQGESTFFVEMSETAAILRHATPNSLVLMDELGRGTATYDGTAIAYAVTGSLVNLGCRCYFSTHYHSLVEAVEKLPSIQLGHMACLVENENEDDPTEETITFLYKLSPGACPKSYGFNAARLAGLPSNVVLAAHKKAKQLELETMRVDMFRKVMKPRNFFSLREAKAIKV